MQKEMAVVVKTVLGSHFGVGEFTTFRTYFSGDWDVRWRYGILTHGQMGMGLKLKHQGTVGFGPFFHLPGLHMGYLFVNPQTNPNQNPKIGRLSGAIGRE